MTTWRQRVATDLVEHRVVYYVLFAVTLVTAFYIVVLWSAPSPRPGGMEHLFADSKTGCEGYRVVFRHRSMASGLEMRYALICPEGRAVGLSE